MKAKNFSRKKHLITGIINKSYIFETLIKGHARLIKEKREKAQVETTPYKKGIRNNTLQICNKRIS